MDASRLANLLDVLVGHGAARAEVPIFSPDGLIAGYLKVTFGPRAEPDASTGDEPPAPAEDLPPGAYDPIAARKRAP